jgi:hypothetical protein
MGTIAVILWFLLHSLPLISAAPLTRLESELLAAKGNKTLLNSQIAPSWATTSNVRSTSDLLWTCVLTLTICIYTVIHINVPLPNETGWAYSLRKIKWGLSALLAPEIVLAAALQQWATARMLKRELNSNYSRHNEGKPEGVTTKKFSMTYCFYVVMGGFVVDVSDIHKSHSMMTLRPLGIVHLAERGHFIEMPEKAIQDKSKADLLAKTLVCLQVMWMIVQCIGRKAQGLPISLLEIHVLVHVACALCIYALWIKVSIPFFSLT